MGELPDLNAGAFVDPAALIDFLDALRRAGYRFGGAAYITAQNLIVALTADGETFDRDDRLERVLRPLLCKSVREQAEFGAHFAAHRARLLPGNRTRVEKPEPPPVAHVADEIRHVRKQARRTRGIAAALVLLGLGGTAWWWWATHQPGMIHIVTEPPGAIVWRIDRTDRTDTAAIDTLPEDAGTVPDGDGLDSLGITPVRWLDPEPGRYDLVLSMPGYADSVESVTIGRRERDREVPISLRPLRRVEVRINTTPDASISLRTDRQDMRDSVRSDDGRGFSVLDGEYTVVITAAGYFDRVERITVPPDSQRITRDFPLSRRPRGSIAITPLPRNADVTIDGVHALPDSYRFAETTTDSAFTLAADSGTYTIAATADGYYPDSTVIQVYADAVTSVRLILERVATTRLRVASRPAGATVFIDGEPAGLTAPADSIGILETSIPQTTHRIRVSLADHADETFTTDAFGQSEIQLYAALRLQRRDRRLVFGPDGEIIAGNPDDSVFVLNPAADSAWSVLRPDAYALLTSSAVDEGTSIASATSRPNALDALMQPMVANVATDANGERVITTARAAMTDAGSGDTVDLDVYRRGSSDPIGTIRTGTSVRTVAFNPDGTMLAWGAADGGVSLLVPSGRPIRAWALNRTDSVVSALTFTGDGDVLVAGGDRMYAWNVALGTALETPFQFGVDALSADMAGRIAYSSALGAGILRVENEALTPDDRGVPVDTVMYDARGRARTWTGLLAIGIIVAIAYVLARFTPRWITAFIRRQSPKRGPFDPRTQYALEWLAPFSRITIPIVAVLLIEPFAYNLPGRSLPLTLLRLVTSILLPFRTPILVWLATLAVTVTLTRRYLFTARIARPNHRAGNIRRAIPWVLAFLPVAVVFLAPARLLLPQAPTVSAVRDVPSASIQPTDSGFVELLGYSDGRLELDNILPGLDTTRAVIVDLGAAVGLVAMQERSNTVFNLDAAGIPVARQEQTHQVVIASDSTIRYAASIDSALSNGGSFEELHPHLGPITALAFAPDGFVASGDRDGNILIVDWVTEDTAMFAQIGRHDAAVTALAFTPTMDEDSLRLISGSADGEIRIWDDEHAYGVMARLPLPVQRIAFSPDGTLLATADADSVRVWSLEPSRAGVEEGGAIVSGPQSETSSSVAFVQTTGNVGSLLWRVPLGRHRSEITSLSFSPDGHRLATASEDSTVIVWDVHTRRPIETLDAGARATGVAFNADGTRLGAVTPDSVRVWDASGSREATVRDWTWHHIRPVLPFFVLVILGLVVVPIMWRRRARLFLHRRRSKEPPDLVNVTFNGLESPLFTDVSLLRIAQQFRRRVEIESTDLDVRDTVRATIDRGGVFTPVMERRQIPPEYLALIDRAAPGDQQTQFVDDLIDRLRDDGVFVARWYFNGNPRICYPQSRDDRPLQLARLASRYPDHRLLLFADADTLFNPITGRREGWSELLEAWSERSLVTPEIRERWGEHEAALDDDFDLHHASPAGLMQRERMESAATTTATPVAPFPPVLRGSASRWIQDVPVAEREIETVITQLRAYLDPAGFHWLAACAVFPAMNWRLTLNLGYALEDSKGGMLLEGERLLALARLPWFRHARMPDWMRQRLIDTLTPKQEENVRQAFRSLLAGAVRGGGDVNDLRIAKEQARTVRKLMSRVLRRASSEAPAGHELNDYLFASFMARSNTDRLRVRVGNRLADVLRPGSNQATKKRGIPWLFAVAVVLSIRLVPSVAPALIGLLERIPPTYEGIPMAHLSSIAMPTASGIVAPTPTGTILTAADSARLESLTTEFVYALDRRDLSSIMPLLSPDIRASWQTLLGSPDVRDFAATLADRGQAVAVGDSVTVPFRMRISFTNAGQVQTRTVTFVAHITRASGEWRTRSITTASDAPPASQASSAEGVAINSYANAICGTIAQSLIGRYPFDSSSQNDASIADVDAILKPGSGSLWRFYEATLRNVLARQGQSFTIRPDAPVVPTAQFLTWFNTLARISGTFYDAGGTGPRLTFLFQPTVMDDMLDVTVGIGQTRLQFTRAQPAAQAIRWDGTPQFAFLRATLAPDRLLRMVDVGPSPWWVFEFFREAEFTQGSVIFRGGFIDAALVDARIGGRITSTDGAVPILPGSLAIPACPSPFVR